MSTLWVSKVEVLPASDIRDAVRDLVNLANLVGCPITTTFNGISLTVPPGAQAAAVLDTWWAGMAGREKERPVCPTCGVKRG